MIYIYILLIFIAVVLTLIYRSLILVQKTMSELREPPFESFLNELQRIGRELEARIQASLDAQRAHYSNVDQFLERQQPYLIRVNSELSKIVDIGRSQIVHQSELYSETGHERASIAAALPILWSNADEESKNKMMRWHSAVRTGERGSDWYECTKPFRDAAAYLSFAGLPSGFIDSAIDRSNTFIREGADQTALSLKELRFLLFELWSSFPESRNPDVEAVYLRVSEAIAKLKKLYFKTEPCSTK